MSSPIRIEGLVKSYLGTRVLHDVSLTVPAGGLTVLTGPSGSGKTTLLNLVAALDRPDAGRVLVGDAVVTAMPRRQRDRYRAGCGHVFQRSGLLGGLTLRENIMTGHALTGRAVDHAWVRHLVARLGVLDVLDAPASRVSGGQAQRAALVRALAHRPGHLFADEPTASLDTSSTHVVHELLHEVAAEEGTTVLLVSHDPVSTGYADHLVRLRDGRLSPTDTPTG